MYVRNKNYNSTRSFLPVSWVFSRRSR